ncbi:MAG: glycoside hydrolase family 32 protein [Anaerococcus sp.]|nr:glycoside hydrolase family 32 protein [Anaerococcus sp.]
MIKVLDKNRDKKDLYEAYKLEERNKYRQFYHVHPISGLLNDPNGFCYYNGYWYLFYQWHPFGPFHGQKHWYMTRSKDLIEFENMGVGLVPEEIFENRGAYSGSGLEIDGKLNVFYTGNFRDNNDIRRPKQVRAVLGEDGKIGHKKVIIGTNKDFTEHQRDPSIYYNPLDKTYYIFLGAQDMDKGSIILYRSKDLDAWEYRGKIKIKGYKDFGYMWECPSFAKVDGKDLLIFSPQGLGDGKNSNRDLNGYLIGKMDFENVEFVVEEDFKRLDHGFEFYASMIGKSQEKTYLISWLGLPDVNLEKNGLSNSSLSLVRNLEIRDGRLYQRPQDFTEKIIESKKTTSNKLEVKSIKPMRILIENVMEDIKIDFFKDKNGSSPLILTYREESLLLERLDIIDRKNWEVRILELKVDKLEIFIDRSSVEIFVNDGGYTLSTRIFPEDEEESLEISSNDKVNIEYGFIGKIDTKFTL